MQVDAETRLPRPLALLITGAIVGATVLSLLWPRLASTQDRGPNEPAPTSLPSGVGVIRRQIDSPGSAGRIGAPAPQFEWNAPDGRTLRLGDLRSKTLVVTYWATWCVPCRQEMPALDAAARADTELVVLGVDLEEDGSAVRAFFDRYALTAIEPLLDTDGATFQRWGVFTLPTTFFIDRDGTIQHLVVGGPMSADAIKTAIRKARSGDHLR